MYITTASYYNDPPPSYNRHNLVLSPITTMPNTTHTNFLSVDSLVNCFMNNVSSLTTYLSTLLLVIKNVSFLILHVTCLKQQD